jgi:hypothetical protein
MLTLSFRISQHRTRTNLPQSRQLHRTHLRKKYKHIVQLHVSAIARLQQLLARSPGAHRRHSQRSPCPAVSPSSWSSPRPRGPCACSEARAQKGLLFWLVAVLHQLHHHKAPHKQPALRQIYGNQRGTDQQPVAGHYVRVGPLVTLVCARAVSGSPCKT